YTNSFLLEITTATEDATIRYTTDGSVPTIFSGKTYDEPVEINRTSIIRALAQKQGFEPSNLDTQTYLFLEDVVDQNADRQAPEGWPSGSVNGQRLHFGMNPDVIDRVGRERMAEALGSLPS
ncbi:MAG: chitobiase/beta-hexosaminidase C-terminal domain-containing protein, partial [Verrucomicrobiales bacterium]